MRNGDKANTDNRQFGPIVRVFGYMRHFKKEIVLNVGFNLLSIIFVLSFSKLT